MSKATLLVVEDDIHLLEGIRTVLELEQYRVVTAENGEQAMNVLNSSFTPPDLIVSDIMMPRMDGIQLLNEVRKNQSWLSIPFIFLTARSEKSDVVRGKRLGVDEYLVKPFDADDLLLAIESRLKRSELIQRAKTEEISDLKKKILTILNHEFRTPLTFLVAYTDMLTEQQQQTQQQQGPDTDTAMFLRGINVGALRLRRLIQNFIYLVEMETGDAARIFDTRKTLISSMMDLLRAAHSNVFSHHTERNCTIWVEDDIPPLIGDPEYLTIAIAQLLDNAVKFSKSPSAIMLGAQRAGDEIVIWVTDQGRGIADPEKKRIWDSFYQINREHWEDQGAGSGLAIVRGVIQLHHGRIDLESEYGKGSTFKIFLPVVGSTVAPFTT